MGRNQINTPSRNQDLDADRVPEKKVERKHNNVGGILWQS